MAETMNRIAIIAIVAILIAVVLGAFAYLVVILPPAQTRIYVDPQSIEKRIGDTFSLNIGISGVSDLYGWEFTLSWNGTILAFHNTTEGTFLKTNGNETFFTFTNNPNQGRIRADCTLLGDVKGISGAGQLATLEFEVKTSGSCDLTLSNIQLSNSNEQAISYVTSNGSFQASSG